MMRWLPLLAATALAVPACTADTIDSDTEEADSELNAKAALFANDVSVLFPLPKAADKDLLLSPISTGDKGELLPASVYTQIPPLVAGGAAREDLRVVSLRIDPCFPGLGVDDPAACKNQLRLVLQPTTADDPQRSIEASDAAIHAFFQMSRDEFTLMAKELVTAKRGAKGSVRTALGIHPLLEQQGLGGTFAQDLKGLVLRHAGSANLTRVTFMTREPARQPLWIFGGFDIANGQLTRMKIATLGNETSQRFATLARNGTATPAVAATDDLSLLFSSFAAQAATADAKAAAYTAALRVQNPGNHSPDTMDCVSCHTATSARIYAETSLGASPTGNAAAFSSKFNLKLTKSPASQRADNLHSFGYLGTEVSISQRTANESAAVADYVNAKILGQR